MPTKKDDNSQVTVSWHVQSQAPNPWNTQGNIGSTISYHQDGFLPNPGYSDATARSQTAAVTPAFPASATVVSTGNFVTTVVITGGTLTQVKVGNTGQTYAQSAQVGTTAGTYIVPPNSVIGVTYSVQPTWTWTT